MPLNDLADSTQRARIVQSVVDDIRSIDGIAPQVIAVSQVERIRRTEGSVPGQQLPYVAVHVEREDVENLPARCLRNTLRLVLDVYVRKSSEQDAFEAAEQLLDEILFQLYKDQGQRKLVGGQINATMTTLVAVEAQKHPDETIGFLEMQVDVTYTRRTFRT